VRDDRTDADVIRVSLVDAPEFAVIFDRYHQDIYRYVARRLGREPAGDIAGEVFARAFAGRSRYDLSRQMCRPWLYGIASNLIRDHLRSQQRRGRAYLRAAGMQVAAERPIDDVEERASAARMLPEINTALGRLRPDDREVLLLYSLGEMSYEEVATSLGIPIGTVRSRLSRARRRMQELIATDRRTIGGGADHSEEKH
jgi:RNA polymerase sigma-70 factor (ECF subfamily)